MGQEDLRKFETSYLFLIVFLMIQVFLIFFNIYYTQVFPIEAFTVIVIELIAILLSYFIGIVPSILFSVSYVVGYVFYIALGEHSINITTYILLFFVPLSTIYAGNMNRMRRQIISDLSRLSELENIQLKIDTQTNLENEFAFKEVISKYSNLAYRYSDYSFSVTMLRLEFIETLKTLLHPKDFSQLIEKTAEAIQNSIREEDSKFIVSQDRFIIITPMTSYNNIKPAIRRIIDTSRKFDVKDKNGHTIDITIKAGGLDYSKNQHEIFKEAKALILELQKQTEVDVYGEYPE